MYEPHVERRGFEFPQRGVDGADDPSGSVAECADAHRCPEKLDALVSLPREYLVRASF